MNDPMMCPCRKRGRTCDACAEYDLATLRDAARADDASHPEYTSITIAPSQDAREREGHHNGGGRRRDDDDADVESPRHSGRYTLEGRTAAILTTRHEEDEHPAWICPTCGPLSPKYPPLEGDDDEMHCSNIDCDDVVNIGTIIQGEPNPPRNMNAA